MGVRADVALVSRGLARSRTHAGDLIRAGNVFVDSSPILKPAQQVSQDSTIVVESAEPDYVSRAGHKLAGALDALEGADGVLSGLVSPPRITGAFCLDAGASTGGFTEVLLGRGAERVLAVDVGHDQLAPSLRSDPRVLVREGLNVRDLSPSDIPTEVDVVVGDLSFISLQLILPALARAAPRAEMLLMVKPQFEVGRQSLGRGGVVRDATLQAKAVLDVCESAAALGLTTRAVVASSLPGPSGNREFFCWFVPEPPSHDSGELRSVIDAAITDTEGQHAFLTDPGPDSRVPDAQERAPQAFEATQAAQAVPRRRSVSRTAVVVTHGGRPEAVVALQEATHELSQAGFEVVLRGQEPELFVDDTDHRGAQEVHPGIGDAEIVIVLGGDGTILRAAELTRGTEVPLVGINLGHVGFLAESEREGLRATVQRIAARDYDVEERDVVDVRVDFLGDDEPYLGWALNEATVEKADRARMIEVSIEVDDRPLSAFGCDGVVLATATGSTAHAFSAGGPVVWPDVDAMLLVPISAHALFARPLVVGPRSTLTVEILERSRERGVLTLDGRRRLDLAQGARVQVSRSADPLRLARMSHAPFTDRLVSKFSLPVVGWRGDASASSGS